MKKTNFLISLLFVSLLTHAQKSTYFGNIVSNEIAQVNGSLSIELFFEADYQTIFTGELIFQVPDNWQAQALTLNGITLEADERVTRQLTFAYPLSPLPFFPVKLTIIQKANPVFIDGNQVYDEKKIDFYIYFTPYNTIEVWNLEDYFNLPRQWLRPELVKDTTRISIGREKIPVYNLNPVSYAPGTNHPLPATENLREVEIKGLAYTLLNNPIPEDSLTFYEQMGDGADSAYTDAKGLFTRNFSGTIVGYLKSEIINDNNVTKSIGLSGVFVKLMDSDLLCNWQLEEAYTDENGRFEIAYNTDQFSEGSNMELFFRFISKGDGPHYVRVSNGINYCYRHNTSEWSVSQHPGIVDVGDIVLKNDKEEYYDAYRCLSWANKGYDYFHEHDVLVDSDLRIKINASFSNSWYNYISFWGETLAIVDAGGNTESHTYHEFGHHVMNRLQGYFSPPWGNEPNPFNHDWDEENSEDLAFLGSCNFNTFKSGSVLGTLNDQTALNQAIELTISPNPVNGIATIGVFLPNAFTNTVIQIVDAAGKVVFQKNISEENTIIQVSDTEFSEGVYLVNAINMEFYLYRKKWWLLNKTSFFFIECVALSDAHNLQMFFNNLFLTVALLLACKKQEEIKLMES